jgi:hypothetical protein
MHTPPSFADVADIPLETDDAIRDRVAALLERAMRRQIWMMFLDDEGYQLPLLMPSAIPRHPGRRHLENFAHFVGDLVDELDAATVVFVLERPGSDAVSTTDREWLTLAVAACHRANVPLRGPLLCHDGGLRWIGPEDVGQI